MNAARAYANEVLICIQVSGSVKAPDTADTQARMLWYRVARR